MHAGCRLALTKGYKVALTAEERLARGEFLWAEFRRKVANAPVDAAQQVALMKHELMLEMAKLDLSLGSIEPYERARVEYVVYRDLLTLVGCQNTLAAGTSVQPILEQARRDRDMVLVREGRRRLHLLID